MDALHQKYNLPQVLEITDKYKDLVGKRNAKLMGMGSEDVSLAQLGVMIDIEEARMRMTMLGVEPAKSITAQYPSSEGRGRSESKGELGNEAKERNSSSSDEYQDFVMVEKPVRDLDAEAHKLIKGLRDKILILNEDVKDFLDCDLIIIQNHASLADAYLDQKEFKKQVREDRTVQKLQRKIETAEKEIERLLSKGKELRRHRDELERDDEANYSENERNLARLEESRKKAYLEYKQTQIDLDQFEGLKRSPEWIELRGFRNDASENLEGIRGDIRSKNYQLRREAKGLQRAKTDFSRIKSEFKIEKKMLKANKIELSSIRHRLRTLPRRSVGLISKSMKESLQELESLRRRMQDVDNLLNGFKHSLISVERLTRNKAAKRLEHAESEVFNGLKVIFLSGLDRVIRYTLKDRKVDRQGQLLVVQKVLQNLAKTQDQKLEVEVLSEERELLFNS